MSKRKISSSHKFKERGKDMEVKSKYHTMEWYRQELDHILQGVGVSTITSRLFRKTLQNLGFSSFIIEHPNILSSIDLKEIVDEYNNMIKKESLVRLYKKQGMVSSKDVINAFYRVRRNLFTLPEYQHLAYEDRPLPIGFNQTISAPHIVLKMNELAKIKKGDKVLDVGSGSGYNASISAELVGKNGYVYSIERIPELVQFAKQNIKKARYDDIITVIEGDGSKGYEKGAPYDAIIVGASAPEIPESLKKQLKTPSEDKDGEGGRLVIPVGDRLKVIERLSEDDYDERFIVRVSFVPLVGKYGHKSKN